MIPRNAVACQIQYSSIQCRCCDFRTRKENLRGAWNMLVQDLRQRGWAIPDSRKALRVLVGKLPTILLSRRDEMRLKYVYLLYENYEVVLNSFGVYVPNGTKQCPIFLYELGGYCPAFDPDTLTLYFPKLEIKVGHEEGEWDMFQQWADIRNREVYKHCYLVDAQEPDDVPALLFLKSKINFVFVSLSKYLEMIK